MEIMIGGDVVPNESNKNLFNHGNINSIMGSPLQSIWDNSDIRMFNLEVPLTDKKNTIDKKGPNLIAPTRTIQGIAKMNPSVVTLANNHILDQGEEGLYSTWNLLKQNNLPFVGAGKNLSQASTSHIIKKDGLVLGIYACAEREFTIATDEKAGANPFDPLESPDHIKDLKSRCDYVIQL